jgi:hypothetical protein
MQSIYHPQYPVGYFPTAPDVSRPHPLSLFTRKQSVFQRFTSLILQDILPFQMAGHKSEQPKEVKLGKES